MIRRVAGRQRLLVPIKNGSDACCAVAYTNRRRVDGDGVSICLLHVEDRIFADPIEKFWGWKNPFGKARQRKAFTLAMRLFSGLDVELAAYIRQGAVVFTILDAAEELDCHEIVVPAPPKGGFMRWLSGDVVTTLLARQRGIRVVLARRDGASVVL